MRNPRDSRDEITAITERPRPRETMQSKPLLEIPEGLNGPQAWMADVLIRVDAEVERIREEVGTAPDPTTGMKGTGMKASLTQLQEDRRFYRLLASLAAGAIVVAELFRVVYSLVNK